MFVKTHPGLVIIVWKDDETRHRLCKPVAEGAVTIMAIWARNFCSSLSSAVIFARASGSAVCFVDLPPLWACFRVTSSHLAAFWFTELGFRGGKWFLCETSVFYLHFFLNDYRKCTYNWLPACTYARKQRPVVGYADISTLYSYFNGVYNHLACSSYKTMSVK